MILGKENSSNLTYVFSLKTPLGVIALGQKGINNTEMQAQRV